MNIRTKQQLEADLCIHFRKFMLELEAMAPTMVAMGTIPGHVEGRGLTGNELVAHALGWTELGVQWCDQVALFSKDDALAVPAAGFHWHDPDPLVQWLYSNHTELDFKAICEKLQDAKDQLVDRIQRAGDAWLCRTIAGNGKSLEQLLRHYVVELYAAELLRLRYWKKGLGWI